MATIEVGNLSDRLEGDEVEAVLGALRKHLDEPGLQLPSGDDSASGTIQGGLDDDVLDEFLDRLESEELRCEYFVPLEFDGKVELSDFTVGSLPRLAEFLEELKDDLDIEDPEADQAELEAGDFDSEMELLQAELKNVWRAFHQGAYEALEASLCLLIVHE
jgi:hypothetical protein